MCCLSHRGVRKIVHCSVISYSIATETATQLKAVLSSIVMHRMANSLFECLSLEHSTVFIAMKRARFLSSAHNCKHFIMIVQKLAARSCTILKRHARTQTNVLRFICVVFLVWYGDIYCRLRSMCSLALKWRPQRVGCAVAFIRSCHYY